MIFKKILGREETLGGGKKINREQNFHKLTHNTIWHQLFKFFFFKKKFFFIFLYKIEILI